MNYLEYKDRQDFKYKCCKNVKINLRIKNCITFAPGEMAEWLIAAVLKTALGKTNGGSNPSLSAKRGFRQGGFFSLRGKICFLFTYCILKKGIGIILARPAMLKHACIVIIVVMKNLHRHMCHGNYFVKLKSQTGLKQ